MVDFNTNVSDGSLGARGVGAAAERKLALEAHGGVANPLAVKATAERKEISEVAQTNRLEELGRERRDSLDRVRGLDRSSRSNIQDEVLLSRDAQNFLAEVRDDNDVESLADDFVARRAEAGEARTEAREEEFFADIATGRETIEREVSFVEESNATDQDQQELQSEILALFGGDPAEAQPPADNNQARQEVRDERAVNRETDNKVVEQGQVEQNQATDVAQRNVQDEITARDTQSVRDGDSDTTGPSDASTDAGRPEAINDAAAAPPPGGDPTAPPTASDNSEQSEQATGVPTLDIVA